MPTVKELRAYIKAHHKDHCPPMSKMRKAELLEMVEKIKAEVPQAEGLPNLNEGPKAPKAKRAPTAFAKFVSEHKGKGLSLKELGEMYRSRKGAVDKAVEKTVPRTRKLKGEGDKTVPRTRKLKGEVAPGVKAEKTVPRTRKLKGEGDKTVPRTRKLKGEVAPGVKAEKTVPRTRKLKGEEMDFSIYDDFAASPVRVGKRTLKADIAAAAAAGQMRGGQAIGIVPNAYGEATPAAAPKLLRKLKKKD